MIRAFAPCLIVCGLLLSLPTAAQDPAAKQPPAGEYQIDTAHASLYFKVGHLGISSVYGRFNEFEGSYILGDTPQFNVTIQTASIDTGIDQRDEHLRTADFFDADQYPEITFKTTSVKVNGNEYVLTGDFTMRGQTREIKLPLTYRGVIEMEGNHHTGFVGSTVIDRREWGMDGFQGAVGNEVSLMISFEGITKK